jgi:tyrosyl-tRNA synthetase
MTTNNNPEQINELLTRGVEKIYPSADLLAKELASGRRLRIYAGFDPSGNSLHIGHAVQINKLAQFQALGHEVIFLIGDFTGMIGDPTDKKAARKQLTREEVLANAANYQAQAGSYLDFAGSNKVEPRYNSEWQDKLNFADLIRLSANFTVGQMMMRDMFKVRVKEDKPIYLHEFLYPLAQAYDSVMLDVDVEVGGNDQMFNMMCGRDLMKALKNKEKFVVTMKLLADDQGVKMGKTDGNAVFLNAEPKEMFGQIMSWPDSFIAPTFEICTKRPMAEVAEIKAKLASGANPMEYKLDLAKELVATFHNAQAADEAREYFRSTVQERGVPTNIKEVSGSTVLEAAVNYFGEAKSKSDIKRLVTQGAVSINDAKIDNFDAPVKSGDLVQMGKRDWFKIN